MNMKEARHSHYWSLTQLAWVCGINIGNLSAIENGLPPFPDQTQVIEFALNTPITWEHGQRERKQQRTKKPNIFVPLWYVARILPS